ncbi:MAG: hypothetical protein C0622_00455 [Desulfuromonas sp.]|nr:MAG: hypothetical protein C0622_00455 [Desulfuromonas sp.]
MMRRLLFCIAIPLLVGLPLFRVEAAMVVIVHPKNGTESMNQRQLVDLYMGRSMNFPNGEPALTLDQAANSQARADFYHLLVDKNLAQVNAYWARLLFTGRSTPPRPLDDSRAVLKAVSENPSAIGYLDSSEIDSSVKVVAYVE